VQSDPIGLERGGNTYLYVRSNPLIFSDFSGLSLKPIIRFPGDLNRKKDRRNSNRAIASCACYRDTIRRTTGIDPVDHMRSGKGELKNPPGTVYHHPEDYLDEVWLVDRCEHRQHHKRRKRGGISYGGGR